MITDGELLGLLRAERETGAALAAVLDLHIALIAARAEPLSAPPVDALGRSRARLGRGEPALAIGDDLHADPAAVSLRARRIASVAGRDDPARAESLARAAGTVQVLPPGLWLCPAAPPVRFLLGHALRPVLHGYASALEPEVGRESWARGTCPVCGGAPDMAALEPETGQRRLLCGRCDTEWQYVRTGCPFCARPGTLGYHAAGAGAYRLYACEACGRYLKTADRRETWVHRPLAVERVLTVGLDVAALREGYRPG